MTLAQSGFETAVFAVPQPLVITDPATASAGVQPQDALNRVANALNNYHEQVPVKAFNSIGFLNAIANNWNGWGL